MKKKIFLFAILMIVPAFSLCFAFAENPLSSDTCKRLDEYISKAVSAYHIPGMSFFITAPEQTLFEKTYGQCTSPEQKFLIGSQSKSFTALCIMQLEEKGLVNLNDDITKYLPQYSFSKPVTVKMLLNQNSGFDTHAKLKNVRVTDSYGKYEYANVNYDLLGKIVEVVSGLSYRDYISLNIFQPLEMADTAADAQSLKKDGKLLKGNRNFFGFFIPGEPDYPEKDSWFYEPAGFISSSPADFQKYLRMYLNDGMAENGRQIISPFSINRMWYDSIIQSTHSSDRYGMGWNSGTFGGEKVLFHGGQVENYISFMVIIPAKKMAFDFKINANDEFGTNNLMDDVVLGIVNILNGEEPPAVKETSYLLIHFILDFLYLLVLAFSLLIFIKSIRPVKPAQSAVPRVKKILLRLVFWGLWPLFLLLIVPLAFHTPLWVVKSYVPDLFFVLLAGSLLPFAGALLTYCRYLLNIL
ncbi:MAG: serine hydrolase [Treponema sp.]|nr:serine hydrolase [Treponema sp.]